MAKTKITDYSTTRSSNADLDGINIQEGCAASNINDALREQMVQLAEANAGTYPVADTWSFGDPADLTKIARLDAGSLPTSTTHAINAAWLQRKGADIASATTTDLSAATGGYVDITGTTTITGFGTVASGVVFLLQFDGALTLTHNASSLILPGGQNITTAAGDTAIMMSEGSGNWRCIAYNSAGAQWGTKGADIASASTTDIASATGDFVKVTGTTTITALGTAPEGVEITVLFSGTLTITHNGTSLILPEASDVITTSGDVAVFRSEGSGNWRCVNYHQSGSLSYVRTNIVGSVGQSSGTPTGAIVETGTAGTSVYTRWADGTQIATKHVSLGTVTFSASGNVYVSSLVDGGGYGTTWASAPIVSMPGVFSSTGVVWPAQASAPTDSVYPQYYLLSSSSNQSTGTVLYLRAEGRWF